MASETPRQGRRRAAKPNEVAKTPAQETAIATTGKGRATPKQRHGEAEEAAPKGIFARLGDYLQGVRGELGKVSWPTREQVVALFRNVVVVTIIAAAVLGLITFGFNELFVLGFRNPIVFVVFGAAIAAATFLIVRRRSQLS
jgi:preprotein translocase SecE subunit